MDSGSADYPVSPCWEGLGNSEMAATNGQSDSFSSSEITKKYLKGKYKNSSVEHLHVRPFNPLLLWPLTEALGANSYCPHCADVNTEA